MIKIKTVFKIALCVSILSICFSCSELVFENAMPQKGQVMSKIPDFFDGQWAEIRFDKYSLSAGILTVDRKTDSYCEVYAHENEYLDSAKWSQLNIGEIDTVLFTGNGFKVIGKNSSINLALSDTIRTLPSEKAFELDLKENYFDDMSKEKTKCQLKSFNGKYVLNIQKEENQWLAVLIDYDGNAMSIVNSTFSGDAEIQNFKSIISKYGIQTHSETLFSANLNDDQFEELMNKRDIFESVSWYKIQDKQDGMAMKLAIGLLVGIVLIGGVYWRMKKK